ncbi:hypothetical protein KOAAANKH_00711 [Brevundimonas sp. NIBR10]|uniref:FecR family protein n=1 Tax=Brevundimonas sp. NIBR10 TaxID=3015997 RepID=UPI0022F1944D|nr:FecR domain-containing protein [Brevundimonas sp. NIBR10]WGM45847.1 hypothetical protein KOAAANKH_00711 [Brevundimonas sp. NIBR10]
MSDQQRRVAKADAEAASWHTRLANRSVSTDMITEFYAWRQNPLNDEAYAKVQTMWSRAKVLEGQPDIQTAIADALARKKTPDRRAVWIGALVASTGIALAIGGTYWFQGRSAYATDVGEERLVQLDDGSTVRLDTGSSIKVAFSGGQRRIELEGGRALFTVAHDTSRPFIVLAGATQVRAVGTVFDVRRAEAGVTVSMVSGLVEVSGPDLPAGPPKRLAAGQRALVSPQGLQTQTINVADATSWADGRLVFRGTPLGQAVDEVNRYLTDKIVLAPGTPRSQPVSGVFHTSDRAAFVSAVCELFQLTAEADPDGSVRLTADKNMRKPLGETRG